MILHILNPFFSLLLMQRLLLPNAPKKKKLIRLLVVLTIKHKKIEIIEDDVCSKVRKRTKRGGRGQYQMQPIWL